MHLLRVKAQIQFNETQGHFCILRSKLQFQKSCPKSCVKMSQKDSNGITLSLRYTGLNYSSSSLHLTDINKLEDCCILWIIQPKVSKGNDVELENKFLVVVLSRILLVMMMMQPILWSPYIFGRSAPYSILHTIEVLSFHKWKNCCANRQKAREGRSF